MSYTGKNIDLSKYEKYGKEKEAVELSKVDVNLAMDFSSIQKRVETRLKDLNKIHNTFLKIAPKIEEVKKGYSELKNVANFEQKEVNKYYNEYDKKAKDLGIDTKSTVFYKEYLDVFNKIEQMEDIIADLKTRL
jgi:thymidylate synthase